MPKRKDQASIWFLFNKIFNKKHIPGEHLVPEHKDITDLEILVTQTHTQAPDVEENVCVVLWKCE